MMSDYIRVKFVEYPLSEHCNLRCANCDHASHLLPKKLTDVNQAASDLSVLSGVLRADTLKILGGEPFLHPNLKDVLMAARSSGIAENIALISNGTLLNRVKDSSIWDLFDQLWISVYPGVRLAFNRAQLEEMCRAHGIDLRWNEIQEFRYTILNKRIADPQLVQKVYDKCKLRISNLNREEYSCYTIYEGRFYKCSPAAYTKQRLELKATAFDSQGDYVPIHNNANLRAQLSSYLESKKPLTACQYCLGSSGIEVAHHQLNREQVQAATFGVEESVESLIDWPKLLYEA